MSTVMLPQDVTPARAERVYAEAKRLGSAPSPDTHAVRNALRAVAARDPRLLLALERIVEVLNRVYEEQLGEMQRQGSRSRADKVKPEVLTFFENAYKLADRGDAGAGAQPYGYLYVATARFAGCLI